MIKTKLPKIIMHPQLVETIVGQFVFMMLMSRPKDHNFMDLQHIDLNEICNKADSFFITFSDADGVIMTEQDAIAGRITEFLQDWKSITDITSIQQNMHRMLQLLDK